MAKLNKKQVISFATLLTCALSLTSCGEASFNGGYEYTPFPGPSYDNINRPNNGGFDTKDPIIKDDFGDSFVDNETGLNNDLNKPSNNETSKPSNNDSNLVPDNKLPEINEEGQNNNQDNLAPEIPEAEDPNKEVNPSVPDNKLPEINEEDQNNNQDNLAPEIPEAEDPNKEVNPDKNENVTPENKPEETPIEPEIPEVLPDEELNENDIQPNPIVPMYSNSIDLYRLSLDKLKDREYSYTAIGTSKNNKSNGSIDIYEYYSKNNAGSYYEKVSSGDKVFGHKTSYAEKVVINGDSIIRESSSNNSRYKNENGKLIVNNWGNNRAATLEEVRLAFGKVDDNYIYYNIEKDCIVNDQDFIIDAETGNITVKFNIKFDNDGNKSSIAGNGYNNHIESTSHQDFNKYLSSEITLTLDSEFNPLSYNVKESYEVISYAIGLIPVYPVITNNVTYTFTY